MVDSGTATFIGNNLHGTRHLYMFGEVLEVNHIGAHFVRRFPWKKQYDMVCNKIL